MRSNGQSGRVTSFPQHGRDAQARATQSNLGIRAEAPVHGLRTRVLGGAAIIRHQWIIGTSPVLGPVVVIKPVKPDHQSPHRTEDLCLTAGSTEEHEYQNYNG